MRKKSKKSIIWVIVEGIILIFVAFLIIKAAKAGFEYANNSVSGEETKTESTTESTVSVIIPQGASTSEIATILKEAGMVDNAIVFRFKSKFGDYDGTYKHGTYTLTVGMDEEEIMNALQKGALDENQIKITIPEGYTAKQIGALLEENGIVSSEAFLKEVSSTDYDYDFIKDIPAREFLLEGYLFPDTYYFTKESSAHDIVDKMLNRFSQTLTEDRKEALSEFQYTLDQIITIASMIEAEIQKPEERKVASGVIYNRLEKNMKLQMCSTVLYALGKRRDVLLLEDLEVKSPYNTYLKEGLPVGPISNPGEAAIEAAFFPDDNSYYYFVLKADVQGEHVFTETYDEFLAAKEKYKQKF